MAGKPSTQKMVEVTPVVVVTDFVAANVTLLKKSGTLPTKAFIDMDMLGDALLRVTLA